MVVQCVAFPPQNYWVLGLIVSLGYYLCGVSSGYFSFLSPSNNMLVSGLFLQNCWLLVITP